MLIPKPPKNKKIRSKIFKRSHKIKPFYEILLKNLGRSIINEEEKSNENININIYIKYCLYI